MRVFVTGHRGYIGSHLVQILKEENHWVTGCDLDLYEGCAWEPLEEVDLDICTDIRNLQIGDLKDHDCVMHLAAISNDPMGNLDPNLTLSVNRDASIRLAQLAKAAEVPLFLFSSSCAIYGRGEHLDLDESAPLNPLTAYAQSKIEAEMGIAQLADEAFSPVFLRNATAYGNSPMLRVDLVVNNLLACAHTRGEIRIKSDGSPWRPLIHAYDIARAFVSFMEAPRERIHNVAVNVGADDENYQVRDVADHIAGFIPDAHTVYTGEVGEDPRSYRVSFRRLQEVLPDFRLQYCVESGIAELYAIFLNRGFSMSDFDGDQFVRLRALRKSLYLLQQEEEPVAF